MAVVTWQLTDNVAEFLAAAGDYLRAERVRNTVLLTTTEQLLVNPARYQSDPDDPSRSPLFGWLPAGTRDAGGTHGVRGVIGAFLHTPPFPVVITAVAPGAAADLAMTLAARPLAGVNGHVAAAEAFTAARRTAADCHIEVHRKSRLYRLAELTWPEPAPAGTARVAADEDMPLITDWFTAFAREVDDLDGGRDQTAAVRDRIGYGGIMLWCGDGVPVSLASSTREVAGMVRIGPVYTPPAERGRGYASAATAAVTARVRAAGAEEVVLFTDLANPVSNSIYQRIGYRPVEDSVVLAFSAG